MPAQHRPHILVLDGSRERGAGVCRRLHERGLAAERFDLRQPACEDVLRAADVAAFVLDERSGVNLERLCGLLARLRDRYVASLVWGAPPDAALPEGALVDRVGDSATVDEVVGRIGLLAQLGPELGRLARELDLMQRLGQQVHRYFEEIDKEMRLAGRLQREFLPQALPARGALRFAALYRPAGWVSGDIYDVFPVDEQRVGVFIGDAMGHGTAAALMSMFLRTALVPTDPGRCPPRILRPAEALAGVHENLCRHGLRQSQFVTAAYALIDASTLELALARGGHPHPVLLRADGSVEELRVEGGLIGVAEMPPDFATLHHSLSPGDKVLLYTDGLDDFVLAERHSADSRPQFSEELLRRRRLDADAFVADLGRFLDRRDGSLNPDDDVTAVVIEVRPDAAP